MRHLLLALLVPACVTTDPELGPDAVTSGCPAGEACSAKTPNGLLFVGARPVFPAWPNGGDANVAPQILADGTDEIHLQRVTDTGEEDDLALPYSAVSSDPSAISVEAQVGSVVTVRGHGGAAFLRIVDPVTGELFDRRQLVSSALSRMHVVATAERVTAAGSPTAVAPLFLYAPGDQTIGMALVNADTPPARLIDTSFMLKKDGATQTAWDQLHVPTATAGEFDFGVGADLLVEYAIHFVATPDQITPLLATGGVACFGAFWTGYFVSGSAWTFTVNGQPVAADPDWGPNCVVNPALATATFTVTAATGGKSLTITTSVGATPAHATPRATIAGERAGRS